MFAIFLVALVPVTLALAPLCVAGPIYWIPALALGLVFIHFALALQRSASTPHAVRLFRYSILYLFLLFVLMTVDAAFRLRGGA
jgi:protoheme IX farnesyltransferase